MLDAVRPVLGKRKRLGLSEEKHVVSLFPGSRPPKCASCCLLLSVADRLFRQSDVPHLLLSVAPFADDDAFVRGSGGLDSRIRITRAEVPPEPYSR